MKKTESRTEGRPIDTGAVVQLITGIKEQSPVFLIAYDTAEVIDREKLRAAVKRALELMRLFRVKLALSGPERKPVYAFNPSEVDVYPYDGKPHAFGRESNGYLFRVYYAENRVLLSMLHALTDFFGANEFLKCILFFYFDILGGRPEEIRKLLAVDPDDARDPYTLYGSKDDPDFSMKRKWRNALEIPNHMQYRRGEAMFALTENAYAMKNAPLDIRQKAKHITEDDNDHNGAMKTLLRITAGASLPCAGL